MEKKKYRVTGERVLHYCGGDVTRIPLETRYTYASSPEKAISNIRHRGKRKIRESLYGPANSENYKAEPVEPVLLEN